MQFAVSAYSLLHRALAFVLWVKDTLENAFKENRVLESDSERKRQTVD
jgi:hypothetical protein